MLRINQLKLPVGHTGSELEKQVKKILRCRENLEITIVRRSVDARKKPELYFNYILDVKVKNEADIYRRCNKKQVQIYREVFYHFPVSGYSGDIRPVIIGTGPAGLFCGYMLAKAGFKPILLERGHSIEQRTIDVESFWENGNLNPESNVQFGEGGAGTFSDGKLNTLVKDKYGRNKKVLSLFVKFGAPEEILYDYKPHIGTDVLRRVVVNIRKAIENMGGEVRFSSKVTGIEAEENQVSAVTINEMERLETKFVVLAPGHSARDTFEMLHHKGILMEAKPFALGMRVEHPQEIINLSQYGKAEEKILGNAAYKVTAKAPDQRGVYSFCMCPGGYVVDASSEQGRLVVNGMSYSGRSGCNANSAIIVSVTPEDFEGEGVLAGMEFQRKLEEKAFQTGFGTIPVERYSDYKEAVDGMMGRENKEYQKKPSMISQNFTPQIKGRWSFGAVHEILPISLSKAFVEGMEQFGTVIKGFNDGNVLVEGVESRTSSPVRILRDENLQSSLKGLYPCGEGAGYAGGITSAAMDGIRVAEELAVHIINRNKH